MTEQSFTSAERVAPRRLLVSEVIQTSGMDCGPAALKALLEGFRIPVSYGRLREACHTNSDGTSIDTLEEIAQALDLSAEQIMLPADHVLLKEAAALPAIAVARTPAGGAHFIVIWRRHGPWVQVMDPARGRLWLPRRTLLGQLFIHSAVVDASAWRDWAGSGAFLVPLEHRLRSLGLTAAEASTHVQTAASDPLWHSVGRLDAGARMMKSLQSSRAIDAPRMKLALRALLEDKPGEAGESSIPTHYWSVRPAASTDDNAERLYLRGAVLVRARGRRPHPRLSEPAAPGGPAPTDSESPEILAALSEAPARPLRDVCKALRADGALTPAIAAAAIVIATFGVAFEAVLLRTVLDISALLTLPAQALAAGGVLVLYAATMLGTELVLASAERRAGSHLETRLRLAFLAKIPRLADSYLRSRPISDMLERSHGAHLLRLLPPLGIRFLRIAAELVVTTAAIAWIDPRLAGLACLSCLVAAGIPLIGNTVVAERDLKVRTHAGALTRFHLDALLGRTAIEAHGAEATMEREHDRLLVEWVRASLALQKGSVVIEGLQMLVGFTLAGWLLFDHLASGISGATLLITYWILNLPALGYELALTAREYPAHRSTLLRLLEPLGAPDSRTADSSSLTRAVACNAAAARIGIRGVTVVVGGNPVLQGINLEVEPGSHVAIVGASGAGKSTLAGLLLGWYRPADGDLRVDGEALTASRVERLRGETAWVDPTLQIWNRSLLDNLVYGSNGSQSPASVLESAGLLPVIAKLPQGLATRLGESGSLLSAGEGQRVRLGRAMMRPLARLVILDEPFLGLERERRRALLTHSRRRWNGRTLLYVTHDVSETRAFDRVVVMERGRIVEEGDPLVLAQMASSRYRRLLQAQEGVTARLTTGAEWKRIRLEAGEVAHEHAATTVEQRA